MARERTKRAQAWQMAKSPLNLYRDDLREALGKSGKTSAAMRRAVNEHGAGVLDAPDEAVKVWSDLHLGHANIIAYQGRPFHDVHEINGALWSNWQLDVDPDDTLVCVGDFALGEALSDETWERVRATPGRLEDPRCRQPRRDRGRKPPGRGVSPCQGGSGFARGSAIDLDPRAVAERAGRAREHPRAPAHGDQAGGLATHQRLGRAARFPARGPDADPAARAGPGCRASARGDDHAGAARSGRGLRSCPCRLREAPARGPSGSALACRPARHGHHDGPTLGSRRVEYAFRCSANGGRFPC